CRCHTFFLCKPATPACCVVNDGPVGRVLCVLVQSMSYLYSHKFERLSRYQFAVADDIRLGGCRRRSGAAARALHIHQGTDEPPPRRNRQLYIPAHTVDLVSDIVPSCLAGRVRCSSPELYSARPSCYLYGRPSERRPGWC